MAHELLNDLEINTLLEQVGGKRVAQAMKIGGFVDFCQLHGLFENYFHCSLGERLTVDLPGKKEVVRPIPLPVIAQ